MTYRIPSTRRRVLQTVAATPLVGLAATWNPANAQDAWPSKAITYVAAFPVGSNTDTLGRLVCEKLSEALKVPVIVDNKAGATGMVGSAFVARAAPDGYTLLGASIASHAINPALVKSMQYDAVKSFEPITIIGMNANTLVVSSDSPMKSLADVIAAAKAKPGSLSYASSGVGTTQHLSGLLLEKMAAIKLNHIPYSGRSPATDVIGGQVDMMFEGPAVIAQVKGGRLRALAVTSPKRLPNLPDVPTVAEQGLPGYEVQAWQAIFAPAGVPPAIVDKLYAELARIIRSPEIGARLTEMGVEPSAITPQAFAAYQKAEVSKWGELVRSMGLKVE